MRPQQRCTAALGGAEPLRRTSVRPKEPAACGERHMENKRERAHDIAEEGLDKIIEGDKESGEKLIDRAKKIDPKAIEELAQEVERDKETADRFVGKK
jgi:uncharacterized protein HemY